MFIKEKIKIAISNLFIERKRKWAISVEKRNIDSLSLEKLDKKEMSALNQTWKNLGLSIKPLFYQMFKTVVGFNSNYLSDDLYYPLIVRTLNPDEYSRTFSHKGFLPFLFNGIPQPKIIVNNIRGVLYDSDMNILSLQTAINKLKEEDSFVIKPTIGTSCGKGVQLVNVDNVEAESTDFYLSSLLETYKQNYIVQNVVKQSDFTKQFNPNSLNTFRVTTLFINGEASICSIVFKIGKKGGICDNLGSGGVIIGVHENGNLWDFALDNKYNKYYKDENQKEYKSYTIPDYDLIASFALDCHTRYFPNLGIVGWDIALSENDTPILIEANLNFPGIQFEQLCVEKPIFGDRTNEVVNFVKTYNQCHK